MEYGSLLKGAIMCDHFSIPISMSQLRGKEFLQIIQVIETQITF